MCETAIETAMNPKNVRWVLCLVTIVSCLVSMVTSFLATKSVTDGKTDSMITNSSIASSTCTVAAVCLGLMVWQTRSGAGFP